MVAGCAGCIEPSESPPAGRAHSAIEQPETHEHPPWASKLVWGFHGDGGGTWENCTASLVRKQPNPLDSWVLTSAHCFRQIHPLSGTGSAFGAAFHADDVYPHPNVWGVERLDEIDQAPDPGPTFSSPWDLALVRIQLTVASEDQFAPIALWYPTDEATASSWLLGRTVTFAGLETLGIDGDGNPIFGPATGIAVAGHRSGNDLLASPISYFQPGDSGGGAWITLDGDAPTAHAGFPSTCAIAPGYAPGDTVLIGVNRAFDTNSDGVHVAERFLATYIPAVAEWIAQVTRADQDGDLVCDDEDNCPDHPNPDRANDNRLAEDAWGGGIHYGNKCDPAPVPLPELAQSGFVESGYVIHGYKGNHFITYRSGRAIRDRLTLKPVLEDGSSLSGSSAQPFFCDCRDADLKPVEDVDLCTDPAGDYRCMPNPRQADPSFTEVVAGQASIALGTTAWHALTQEVGGQPVKGAVYAPVDYPGPALERTWLYQDDYAYWVTQTWMLPAGPPGNHGPGTDLGGGLWFHDPTERGAEAHGLPPSCFVPDSICGIADGFLFGVGPDLREASGSGTQILLLEPLPLCPPLCPRFDRDELIYPAPFFMLVPDGSAAMLLSHEGARDATELLSPALRQALSRPDVLLIPASEPATLRSDELLSRAIGGEVELTGLPGEPSSPRALFIVPDAEGGLGLEALVRRSDGVFDLALVEALGGEVLGELARLWSDPDKRVRLAVVYSRTADTLFVVHGGDAEAPLLPPHVLSRSRPRPALEAPLWTTGPLSLGGVFGASPRAVFSPRDWRLWVVDASGPPGHLAWRLRRIAPSTGVVQSEHSLTPLSELEDLWLTTYDDGRVLLAGNRRMGHGTQGQQGAGNPARFVLAMLSSLPFAEPARLSVDGVLERPGRLITAPVVARGAVSLLVQHLPGHGTEGLAVEGVIAADLVEAWPELSSALEGP